ncbi:MAG: tyrosine recombinase XerC [Gammaproteobacteria bacterium]|nr:tyrosine recombinase XerC [Gammaproteobacteria bacterium]MCP5199321.1 tyrosine recombinase XerC [Gammaproteobacteria bacterium]
MASPAVLQDGVEAFLLTLRERSPHTRSAYARDLAALTAFLTAAGIATWAEVDDALLRRFVAARHRDGAHGRSLGRQLSACRGLFRFLAARGIVDGNPAQAVRPPKAPQRLPRALDVDQMGALLEPAGDSDDPLEVRDRAMWELLYSSGLRVSELTGLDLADLDLEAREARVLGKGRKQRLVPVGRQAQAAVLRWLALRPTLAAGDEHAVFVNHRGRRLGTRGVESRLRRWALRHGIEARVHPHMLRHSFASHMLESSGDLRAVQELLGHANIATTQVYTHLDFQHLARVYDAAHPRARKRRD